MMMNLTAAKVDIVFIKFRNLPRSRGAMSLLHYVWEMVDDIVYEIARDTFDECCTRFTLVECFGWLTAPEPEPAQPGATGDEERLLSEDRGGQDKTIKFVSYKDWFVQRSTRWGEEELPVEAVHVKSPDSESACKPPSPSYMHVPRGADELKDERIPPEILPLYFVVISRIARACLAATDSHSAESVSQALIRMIPELETPAESLNLREKCAADKDFRVLDSCVSSACLRENVRSTVQTIFEDKLLRWRLIGLRHTPGSIFNDSESKSAPIPRCLLFEAARCSYFPMKASTKLSAAGRALAKHCHRSVDDFWGTIKGSDIDKNNLAEFNINRILDSCVWLNLHLVPSSFSNGEFEHSKNKVFVFEVRTSQGYGARWELNVLGAAELQCKFRGFLEPIKKK